MKNFNKVLLCVFLLFIFPLSIFAYDDFSIEHYKVDIDVKENNSYHITEIIDVDFPTERHGIFRTLPLRFDKNWVEISEVYVKDFEYIIEKDNEELTIRIGSEYELVEGLVQYIISYVYDVGADDLSNMDEFYHNVIGGSWDVEIKAVDFTINLPKPFDASKVNCTSGYSGSTDTSNVEWKVVGNKIIGKTIESLYANDALTVALPLPEGYWIGAVKHSRSGSWFYRTLFYPICALVIIFSVLLWFKHGRDNKLFPTIQFAPPEGLTPAEIGYVIDGCVDAEDVTSLILYWADQGLLEIEEGEEEGFLKNKKVLTITKLKDIPESAKGYEKRFFKYLFEYGDGHKVKTTDLKDKFYTVINATQAEVAHSFRGERALYVTRIGCNLSALAGLFCIIPISIILAQFFLFLKDDAPLWILAPWVSAILLIPAYQVIYAFTSHTGHSLKKIIVPLLITILALGAFYFLTVVLVGVALIEYLAGAASSLIALFFSMIMGKRTKYGDEILEKVLGFKDFIENAEKDRLETMFFKDPKCFYNILPYAMVMGISDKWAKHFETMSVEPPNWYSSGTATSAAVFSTAVFTSSLNSSLGTLNAAMSSSPSSGSSGSGGSSSGGSSGGGSGGGGGGSW